MILKNKINQAKSKLMLSNPYFGTIASSLKLESVKTIESFISDGISLKYNSEYFNNLDIEDIEFALANGAMHMALSHKSRANDRYTSLWQLASDLVVNSLLIKNGFNLPDKVNYQDRFRDSYVEEVYDILLSETDNDFVDEDSSNIDKKREKIGVEESLESVIDEEFLDQLFDKLEKQSQLPKGLNYLLPAQYSNSVDWRTQLYRYISSYDKSTFSFFPPNMKYLYRGIYVPALSGNLLHIVVAIDTSGSIDDARLSLFLGELESIIEQYPNYQIELLQADDKIQSHDTFLTGEKIVSKIKGRGATNFKPVFDYIQSYIDNPTVLIYFTDGDGVFPTDSPPYDTLWIVDKNVSVPFGETIIML